MLEGDSPTIHSEIRLVQYEENNHAEINKLIAAQKNMPSIKNGLTLVELVDENRRSVNRVSYPYKVREEPHLRIGENLVTATS